MNEATHGLERQQARIVGEAMRHTLFFFLEAMSSIFSMSRIDET